MDPSVPPFGSRRRGRGKGKAADPHPPPTGARRSSTQEGATSASKENVVMIEMIYQIHKDYRTAIDALSEQIKALTEEVSTLKNATPRPDTPTPIPFPLLVTAPERATAPDSRPVALPTAAPHKL